MLVLITFSRKFRFERIKYIKSIKQPLISIDLKFFMNKKNQILKIYPQDQVVFARLILNWWSNKARYTATPVSCGWTGAIFEVTLGWGWMPLSTTILVPEVSRFFVLQYRPGRSNHGRSQKKYRLSIDHGSIFCQLVLFPYINAVYFQSNMSQKPTGITRLDIRDFYLGLVSLQSFIVDTKKKRVNKHS